MPLPSCFFIFLFPAYTQESQITLVKVGHSFNKAKVLPSVCHLCTKKEQQPPSSHSVFFLPQSDKKIVEERGWRKKNLSPSFVLKLFLTIINAIILLLFKASPPPLTTTTRALLFMWAHRHTMKIPIRLECTVFHSLLRIHSICFYGIVLGEEGFKRFSQPDESGFYSF